ncbi:hypothetical protein AB5N19_01785 [Seiridium cardinale]
MSDARALLRAHRAAHRIEHPHAAYSDAGKLLCKVCREPVKPESLWDSHIRSTGHKQRIAAIQAPAASIETSNKRKHDDVEAMEVDISDDTEETLPKKRTRTASTANGEKEMSGTPPGLTRRTSATPAQGVEISIPSRPATPKVGEGSQTSTPNLQPLGRSPLIGAMSDTSSTPNTSASAIQLPISTEALTSPAATATAPVANGAIDENEWAAFEAEVAATDVGTQAGYADAVISAPALTADELAAKSQEEENARKKTIFDTEIADEKEDATRALEDEFDEMEQLESRVRKLKERREELRKGSIANLRGAADSALDKSVKAALGKENAGASANGGDAESDEDEDDDDDWDDGFHFRGA